MIRLTLAILFAVTLMNLSAFDDYMVQQALNSCPETLVECD